MFVPNAAQAVIATPKITDYLLKNPGKAKFFMALGSPWRSGKCCMTHCCNMSSRMSTHRKSRSMME